MPQSKIEPEFAPAYQAWSEQPGPDTAGELIRAVSPVLDSAMRSYGGGRKNPALRAKAKTIALGAMPSYNPQTGPLRPHLMSHLQGLRRARAKQQQVISMPERVVMDRIRTEAAGRELEDRLGRVPSDNELADYMGLSLKRLSHIRQAARPVPAGAFEQPTAGGETGGYLPAAETPGRETDRAVTVAEFIMEDLNPTDQIILQRALGLNGLSPMKPAEIADMLQISRPAVSQRLARIQTKLDELDETGIF